MFGSNNKSRIVSIVKTPEGEDAADTEPRPLEVETAAAPDPDDNKYRNSAANRLIGEVVQSRRRPLLGPSPG